MIDDEYLTIARESSAEIKVKGSRFIGQAFLACSIETAEEKLIAVRKQEHAATHNCYAYRIGLGPEQRFKYSDDGEPSQSAGKPIYDQICGRSLQQILTVVTRYYGGTKLGTGGLARAYSEATAAALDKAGRQENFLTTSFKVILDFSHYDRWQKTLATMGARVIESDFAVRITQRVEIRRSLEEQLRSTFVELTSGKGEIHDA